MPYDTESKSRNAPCVPFRGRGPQGGEGMYEGKNDYDTLILCLIALRSGGRRLAVRTAMEHPIGTLPRTPFPASRDFAPMGSMSLDFQIASLSCKSSSFATSRENEKIGGTGYCVTYNTDSQSRNADFISIARKGDTSTLGAKGPVKLKNPPAAGRSILRTLTPQVCSMNPHAEGACPRKNHMTTTGI